MKRAELIRRIEKGGCLLIRHGSKHDWYQNPKTIKTMKTQPIPRHAEINESLARHILYLDVTADR